MKPRLGSFGGEKNTEAVMPSKSYRQTKTTPHKNGLICLLAMDLWRMGFGPMLPLLVVLGPTLRRVFNISTLDKGFEGAVECGRRDILDQFMLANFRAGQDVVRGARQQINCIDQFQFNARQSLKTQISFQRCKELSHSR